MTQIVLVLEENPEIQLVIAASLKDSDISVTQESNPDLFVEQARNLSPDLIFLSNSDSEQDYKNCREIREEKNLTKTPIILLANAKDEIDDGIISELGINGLLRKPFEASMLQEQLSPFITLDENYGTGLDKSDEEFMVDMGSIDNQLKEIRDGIQPSNTTGEEDAQVIDGFEQNTYESGFASLPASEMDSMILGDFWVDRNQPEKSLANEELAQDEIEKAVDVVEEITEDEVVVDVLEENAEDEIGMDDGFEFDLKLDEDEVENDSETTATETVSDETTSAPDGLEQLKNSGLEDKFAENRLAESQPAETISKDQVEEPEQNLRGGLTEIDLEINDFEDLDEIWSRPPDLDQTLREGLTDISLDQADFQPEFPKNLSIFEAPAELPAEDINVGEDPADSLPDMDYFELKQDTADETLEEESSLDNLMLTDSEELFADEVEDVEQFVLETSADEFEEMLDVNPEDAEINTMVQYSLKEQGNSAESALGELEDLSEQMEALEAEESEFEAEEEEYEADLEKEEFETERFSAEETTEAEEDPDDDLAVYMEEELGDLLEADEDESDTEDYEKDSIVEELEETVIEGLDDLVDDIEEIETEIFAEMLPDHEEEVFDSWEDAEDAFMGFDRETEFSEKDAALPEMDDEQKFEKSESYRFTEDELKTIVSSSVQKALEKSIASSLVELAVSELKTQVAQMDQG